MKWNDYRHENKVPKENCYVLAIIENINHKKFAVIAFYHNNSKTFSSDKLNKLSEIYNVTFEPESTYIKLNNLNDILIEWTQIPTKLITKYDRLVMNKIH